MTVAGSTTMSLKGVDLEVRRKGSGPAMLMLHGGGGPNINHPFADKLAEKFELIEPVHPGFGGTPIPPHFDGLEDLVYVYLDLMDSLELRMSSSSAIRWAAGLPPRSRCATRSASEN